MGNKMRTSTQPTKRLRALAAVFATALTTGAVTADTTAAHAADTTWARASNGVLYEGCPQHPWRYQVSDEQAQYDWAIFVTVYDPRGAEVTSGSVWADDGAPASGTATGNDALQLCNDNRPGTYTMTSEIHFYGGPFDDQDLPTTTFTMRRAQTRTTLSVNDRTAAVGQVLKFKITSLQEFPRGYFGDEYETVVLKRKTPSGWKRIGGDDTNDRGVVTLRKRWLDRGPVKVRALTPRTSSFDGSASRTITIR